MVEYIYTYAIEVTVLFEYLHWWLIVFEGNNYVYMCDVKLW